MGYVAEMPDLDGPIGFQNRRLENRETRFPFVASKTKSRIHSSSSSLPRFNRGVERRMNKVIIPFLGRMTTGSDRSDTVNQISEDGWREKARQRLSSPFSRKNSSFISLQCCYARRRFVSLARPLSRNEFPPFTFISGKH